MSVHSRRHCSHSSHFSIGARLPAFNKTTLSLKRLLFIQSTFADTTTLLGTSSAAGRNETSTASRSRPQRQTITAIRQQQSAGGSSEDLAAMSSSDEHKHAGPGSGLQGLLLMAAVACMWGTSPVATRALYSQPGPPTPAALGTVQATMAFLWLTLLNRFASRFPWAQAPTQGVRARDAQPGDIPRCERNPEASVQSDASQLSRSDAHDVAMAQRQHEPSDSAEIEQQGLLQQSSHAASSVLQRARATVAGLLNRPAGSQLEAGLELGALSAAANAATLLGFEDTLAARGAFLLRMSVMFTPILSALAGQQTPRAVWIGAATAFAGGLLIAGDDLSSQGHQSSSILSLSAGDAALIVAALLWAVQITRQGRLAPQYPPIALAANQLGFMALGLGLWLSLDVIGDVTSGQGWTTIWPGAANPLPWLIALWPAIFPWGLGGVLQLKAQTMVSPSLTNIVLATDPLWATLFSGLLGSGEQRLGVQGWLGGGLIILACVIASRGKADAE